MEMEFRRNGERYQFLKWGTQAFNGLPRRSARHRHRAPGESRIPGAEASLEKDGVLYPDTLVGTDSHTTMINGLGIVGWGVGGIEAEAANARPAGLLPDAGRRRRASDRPRCVKA